MDNGMWAWLMLSHLGPLFCVSGDPAVCPARATWPSPSCGLGLDNSSLRVLTSVLRRGCSLNPHCLKLLHLPLVLFFITQPRDDLGLSEGSRGALNYSGALHLSCTLFYGQAVTWVLEHFHQDNRESPLAFPSGQGFTKPLRLPS